MECIKVLTGAGSTLNGRLLLYDGLESRFRVVKLRGRTSQAEDVKQLIDYVQFCGSGATDKDERISILEDIQRMSVKELNSLKGDHLLIDVRWDIVFGSNFFPLHLKTFFVGVYSYLVFTTYEMSSFFNFFFICKLKKTYANNLVKYYFNISMYMVTITIDKMIISYFISWWLTT